MTNIFYFYCFVVVIMSSMLFVEIITGLANI
jgi:hypothetical protein